MTEENGTENGQTGTGTESGQAGTGTESGQEGIFLIEATVIGYLTSALQTEHVYAERPADPPEEFYLVERTSSGETNHIQTATIAVQSYAGSMLRAAEMNRLVRKAMPRIIQTEADVSSCRLNSAYNYTDTETRQYRYQAVFDLYYMEGE